MICTEIESILVPEDNRRQNPNESYTNKYQKHVACSYDYKLVCVNDKNVVSFLNHTHEKMLFTVLLAVCSKKVNIVVT